MGDEVYLFSGDSATNLTGYSHGFSFGGAEANVVVVLEVAVRDSIGDIGG